MIKAIGRNATKCRKCGGEAHWVNKLGGLACVKCSPAQNELQVVATLCIRSGVWADAREPDEWDCSPAGSVSAATGNAQGNESHEGPGALRSADVPDPCEILDVRDPGHCEPAKGISDSDRKPRTFAFQRGPSGELSEQELNLFTSDELWQTPPRDPANPETHMWVTLKPKVRAVVAKPKTPKSN